MQAGCISNVIIWGNHSSTQYPDVRHATVKVDGKAISVPEAVKDDAWLKGEFIKVRVYHHKSNTFVSGDLWNQLVL